MGDWWGEGPDQTDVKRAIARTRYEERRGTAFLVADRLLLTCRHNLEDSWGLGDRVELEFTNWEHDDRKRTARQIWVHPSGWDLALLELEGELPPPGVRPLTCVPECRAEDSFGTYGYPMATDDDGHTVRGSVRDPKFKLRGWPAMQLHSTDANANVGGLSGAPVMIDGRVAGVISFQLRERAEDAKVQVLETLYAIPVIEAMSSGRLNVATRAAASGVSADPVLAAYLEWVAEVADRVPIRLRAEDDAQDQSLTPLYVRLAHRRVEGRRREPLLGRGAPGAGERVQFDLHDLLRERPTGRWTLQGDPGSGKSTSLRELAVRKARLALARLRAGAAIDGPSIPLVVDLAVAGEKELAPMDLLAEEVARVRPGLAAELPRRLEAAFDSGQAILLLDGMDEVRPAHRGKVRELVSRWHRGYARCPIIMTSRRFGYLRPDAAFEEIEILPLGFERQRELLERWLKDPLHVTEILEQINASPSLQDLAANPFVLTLIALMARARRAEDPLKRDPLPTRRVALYREIVGRLVRGCARPEPRPRLAASPEEVYACLRALAARLLRDHAGPWSREELVAHLGAVARRLSVGDPAKLAEDLEADTGLLVATDDAGSSWRFLHRSLLEFLAAEDLAALPAGELRAFVRRISGSRWYAPWTWGRREEIGRWAEVFALLAGMQRDEESAFAFLQVLSKVSRKLVERALPNVDELSPERVLQLLRVSGSEPFVVRELIERVSDREALAKLYVRLARRSEKFAVFCDAALVVIGADDAYREEIAQRKGGRPPSGMPLPTWTRVPEGERSEVIAVGMELYPRAQLEGSVELLAGPVTLPLALVISGDNAGGILGLYALRADVGIETLARPFHGTWRECFELCVQWTLLEGRRSHDLADIAHLAALRPFAPRLFEARFSTSGEWGAMIAVKTPAIGRSRATFPALEDHKPAWQGYTMDSGQHRFRCLRTAEAPRAVLLAMFSAFRNNPRAMLDLAQLAFQQVATEDPK